MKTKKQLSFFGHMCREEKLENLVSIGNIEGKIWCGQRQSDSRRRMGQSGSGNESPDMQRTDTFGGGGNDDSVDRQDT